MRSERERLAVSSRRRSSRKASVVQRRRDAPSVATRLPLRHGRRWTPRPCAIRNAGVSPRSGRPIDRRRGCTPGVARLQIAALWHQALPKGAARVKSSSTHSSVPRHAASDDCACLSTPRPRYGSISRRPHCGRTRELPANAVSTSPVPTSTIAGAPTWLRSLRAPRRCPIFCLNSAPRKSRPACSARLPAI